MDLLRQAEDLNQREKYQSVIDLLNDKKLREAQKDALYIQRGIAWAQLNDEQKSIEDFTKAIELNQENSYALNYRGWLYGKTGNFVRAINDFNAAIKINPNDAYAFQRRGQLWLIQKDYKKALADLLKSCDLNPNNPQSYNLIGQVYYQLKKYKLSINYFNKAIKINPDFKYAYYNIGLSLIKSQDPRKAIKYFTKAINLDPNYFHAYHERGMVYYESKDFEKASNDFDKVLKLSPSFESLKLRRTLAKLRLGLSLKENDLVPDSSLTFSYTLIEKLIDSPKKDEVTKHVLSIVEILDRIRSHSLTIPSSSVAHYCKLLVADSFVTSLKSEECKFRYYNVVYMNDPEEGKIIFDCIKNKNIEKSFIAGRQKEENNVYLGSFLPDSHEDDLVMWRTYGKDEKNLDASGCCIVINNGFFDKQNNYLQSEMLEIATGENNISFAGQSLHKVIYYDKRKKKILGDKSEDIQAEVFNLKKTLLLLINLKAGKNRDEMLDNTIDKITFRILSELRYLFKSADYFFENEVRVIQYVSSENNRVKIDNNNNQWLPKRLYIESTKPIQPFLERIVLGPKVLNPEQWMYLEVSMKKMGFNVELKQSQCKFQ